MVLRLLSFIYIVTLIAYIIPTSIALPFIVIHGIGQKCTNQKIAEFTRQLSEWSAAQGYCIEGSGGLRSWLLPLEDQVTVACSKVKQLKELNKGFHIVGLSQGNLIARGIIEFCDGVPPVKNYISLAGPHAGIASAPSYPFRVMDSAAAKLIKFGIYRNFIQNHLAASGYFKIPNNIAVYLDKSKFLPKLNNEIPNERKLTYKKRFKSLENLVLIKFDHDKALNPKETSWFGYYPDGSFCSVFPPQQTKLYVDDWIGLKALDDAGKVKYVSLPGTHLVMSQDDMKKYIVPYLKDSKIVQQNTRSGTLLETQTDDNRYCSNDLSAVMLKSKQKHDISYCRLL